MKYVFYPALTGLILFAPAIRAVAAPATPEEAAGIVRQFEKYFGPVAQGDHPLLTMAPAGDSYTASLDFSGLAAKASQSGLAFTVTPQPMTMKLTRQPDGKWRIIQADDFAFSYKSAGASGELKAEGVSSDSLFDPAPGAVISGRSDIRTLSMHSIDASGQGPAANVTRVSNGIHTEITGGASGPDSVTYAFVQTIQDTKQHISMGGSAGTPAGAPALDFELSLGAVKSEGRIEAIRNSALLDLWAWFVAHPSQEAIAGAQAELKPLLRSALPVFGHLDVSADVRDVAVTAMGGQHFAASEAVVGFGLNGAGQNGLLRETIALKGVALPAGLLPAWSVALTPKDVSADLSITGYDLARFAEAAIAAFNLESKPPIPANEGAGLVSKLLPDGLANMKLADFSISGAGYKISASGEANVGPGLKPLGSVTIRAMGLDAIQRAIADAAKTDKSAQQAVAMLGMARLLSKPGPDGSAQWALAMGADGKMTVNGNSLGGPAGK